MSGTGVGNAVALLLYGAGKIVIYGVGGTAWLAYHGVKASAKVIHQAYVANEARRRRNALEELRSVESGLARIAEHQLVEMEALETEMDKSFETATAEMEKGWERSLELTKKAEVHMDEALVGLHEWYDAQEKMLKTSFDRETRKYAEMTAAACERISARIMTETADRAREAMEALEGVEDTIRAKEERYRAYASRTVREAREMLEFLQRTYDCDTFAAGELVAAKSSLEEAEAQLEKGMMEAAAGSASIASQNVQFLQLYAEQRSSQFAREKMLVERTMSELAETARASHDLLGDCDAPEIEAWLREGDASFWSEKRLDALWEKADGLARQAEQFSGHGTVSAMALIHAAQELRLQIIREYNRTRLHIASRENTMELAQQLMDAHETAGWTMTEDGTFLGGDCRNDVRLTFRKKNDLRVVMIHNAYDAEAGVYTQQLIRFAEEEGEPDEAARQAEDDLINQALSGQGVPESMQVHCDTSTLGLKSTQ